MNDTDDEICVVCHTEKIIGKCYNKNRECKQSNNKRVLKRYYNNEDVFQKNV